VAHNFDTEIILQEILAVLEKQGVSAKSVAVDISLLPQDFETVFPQLKGYEAGIFYRPLVIHNIPVTLQVKRRIQFDDIVHWLEKQVLPFVINAAEEIKHSFADVATKVHVNRRDNDPHSTRQYSYLIDLSCHLGGKAQIGAKTVLLSIDLAQFDATSYPEIHASVGWLIDEENDGSFGLDLVYNLFSGNQEVHEGILQMVKSSLPDLYQHLKVAIGTGLQEDSGR
jgi:hypothetical protein